MAKLMLINGVTSFILITTLSIIGYFDSKSVAEKSVFIRLDNLSEAKAEEIARLFTSMQNDLKFLSTNPTVVDHIEKLIEAYDHFAPSTPGQKRQVLQSLRDEFLPQYQKVNPGQGKARDFLPIKGNSQALQLAYIVNNPNKLGEKQKLSRAGSSPYDQLHAKLHPWLNDFLQAYGYYDLFLIDVKNLDIVYSVFKERDFATSLKKGPFKNSNLAKLVQQVAATGEAGRADFASYKPSYGFPAAFLAAPIKSQGRIVAIVALQISTDRLNKVMIGDKDWKGHGYGDTGEVFLVGKDQLMRSESREFIENQAAFFQAAGSEVSREILSKMKHLHTTIGLFQIDSSAIRKALAGKEQHEISTDFRGIEVLTSYRPVSVPGLDWAVVAKQDKKEAFVSVIEMEKKFIFIGLLIFAVSMLVIYFIAKKLAAPLLLLTRKIIEISDTKDLTLTLELDQKDEIGQTILSFNKFLHSLRDILSNIRNDALQLLDSSHSLAGTAATMSNNAEEIQTQSGIIASASEELTVNMNTVASATEETSSNFSHIDGAIGELSSNIDAIASATNEASTNMQGMEDNLNRIASETQDAASSITDLSQVLATVNQKSKQALEISSKASTESEETQAILEQLNEMAEQIGGIVRLIGNIASQTSMLALNATIEATNAGAAGKGFSVVAEEVKGLSKKTSEANDEIRKNIESIQKQITISRGKIQTVVSVINQVGLANQEIAEQMTIQSAKAKETSNSMESINKATQLSVANTKEAVQGINETSKSVSEIASHTRESARNISEGVKGVEEIARSSDEAAIGLSEVNQSLQKNSTAIHEVDQQAHQVAESAKTLSQIAEDMGKVLSTLQF